MGHKLIDILVEVLKAFNILKVHPIPIDISQRPQIEIAMTGNLMFVIFFLLNFKLNFPYWGEAATQTVVYLGSRDHRLPGSYVSEGNSLLLLCHVLDVVVLLDVRVESVLDLVLGPTWELFADLWPFASNLHIQLYYFYILLGAPLLSLYSWVKLVYEPLSDLLACFGTDHLR